MSANFTDRLMAIQAQKHSTLALLMAPRVLQMPLPIQKYDDPFLPFGKAIITATRDIVCAYVFDLAAYMAIGAAGMVALERTIAFAGSDTLTILHGPFASEDYVQAMQDTAFSVDAVTLVDEEHLEAYTANTVNGAFIVRRGESPVVIPLPGGGGVYWQDAALFTMLSTAATSLQIQLAGDKTLYAGRGEDFGERVRAALEALR